MANSRTRQTFRPNNPITSFKLESNKPYNDSAQSNLRNVISYQSSSKKGVTELIKDINSSGEPGAFFVLTLNAPPSKRDTFQLLMTLTDDTNKAFIVNFNNVIIAP